MSFYYSLEKSISQNNIQNRTNSNFLRREILSRMGNLLLIPITAITNTADTAIGVLAEVLNTATGSKILPLLEYADRQLSSSKFIVAKPYHHLICMINPKANPIASNQDGIFAVEVKGFLTRKISKIRDSDNLFFKHVVSRLGYAVMAVALTISRVVDGIIGIVAAILSVITIGKINKINQIAFHGLQCTGVIQDVLYCIRKVVNPNAGKFERLH